MRDLIHRLLAPFEHQGRPNWPVLTLFILINGLVFANAILHDPYTGYDAADHINYIKTLATKRALPSCKETAQCYVPPLPYILPAIMLSTGRISLWQVAKLAQLINFLLSIGLTYYLLKICDLMIPRSIPFATASLAMLGILPVYYRTFAFIRGEPYLAFLCVFAAHQVLSIFLDARVRFTNILALGLAVGMCILARQWGFLMLPAILSFVVYAVIRDRSKLRPAMYVALACLLTPIPVAGWYYYLMFQRYGTFLGAGWERNESAPSQTPLPLDFYLGTGSGKLFTDPVRPNFANQLPAIFYADTWGDYGEYFLIYARGRNASEFVSGAHIERILEAGPPPPQWLETNRYTLNTYLGRVNLVSLLPTAVFVAGWALALVQGVRSLRVVGPGHPEGGMVLALLIITCSLAGYVWFLTRYQTNGQAGDLIKASHMLQVFPFLALLAGSALEQIRTWRRPVWTAIMIALALVYLYNMPAMITHYMLPRSG